MPEGKFVVGKELIELRERVCTLAKLPVGMQGVVLEVQANGSMRKRLLDLGLVPGTVVESIRRSPTGDPTAFGIRGAVVALRKTDGDTVFVQPVAN